MIHITIQSNLLEKLLYEKKGNKSYLEDKFKVFIKEEK